MNKNILNKKLLGIIEAALDKQGLSAREASMRATGTAELIRNMRRGRVPSVERIRALCKVLKLEFYVGPERSRKLSPIHSSNKRDDVYNMLQEIISRLPARNARIKTAEPSKPYSDLDEIYYIPVVAVDDTTNKDSATTETPTTSHVAFQSSWLNSHQLDPEDCVMVQVRDVAMEPTVPKNAIVLVDRSLTRLMLGQIYVLRTTDGLLIRRVDKNKDEWQLIGDHPQCKPIPCPATAEVIGQVRWMAKTFE